MKRKEDVEAPVGPSFDEPLFAATVAADAAGEQSVQAQRAKPSTATENGEQTHAERATDMISGSGEPAAAPMPNQSDIVGAAGTSSASGEAGPSDGRGETQNKASEGELLAVPGPTGHHPRGMSRWPAVLACPCFEGKEASADAAEGTRLHALLAGWLTALRDGVEPEVDVGGLSFHEAGAWRAFRAIRAAVVELGLPFGALRVEERVTLFDAANRDVVFGTADCLLVDGERGVAHVWDFKSFFNPGRDYSAQLLGYGLGAALSSKTPIETIRWTVLYGDHEEAESGEASKAEAMEVFQRAMSVFDNRREHVPAKPCQCNWCELCARFPACRACAAVAEDVRKEFQAAEGSEVLACTLTADGWGRLTSTRKAQMLVLAEFCGKFADAVRAKAKEDLLAGVSITDPENGIAYALRETRGRLKLDCDLLWAAAKAKGVQAADFRGCLKPDAVEAKKVLRAAGLTAKAADEVLESCGVRGAGSQTLVRA